MRRALLVTIVALAAIIGGAGVASASDTSTSCLYQRWWTPKCEGHWVVSIKQEDAANRPRKPHHAARTVTTYRVHRGDTLWRIAVRAYGPSEHAGHRWKVIALANHLHGTSIRVGQVLRIPHR